MYTYSYNHESWTNMLPWRRDIPQFSSRNLVPAAETCLDIEPTSWPTSKFFKFIWELSCYLLTCISRVLWSMSQYISIWSWLQYFATSILSWRNFTQTSCASVAGGDGFNSMSSDGASGSPFNQFFMNTYQRSIDKLGLWRNKYLFGGQKPNNFDQYLLLRAQERP